MPNKFQFSGTGHCGTGYVAKVLTKLGTRCSHEGTFDLGGIQNARWVISMRNADPEKYRCVADSSWLSAPFLGEPELDGITIVHLVRDPKKWIDSVLRYTAYVPVVPSPLRYVVYGESFIPEIEHWKRRVDRAVLWYLAYNRMCEEHADIRHRIEDPIAGLLDQLGIEWTQEIIDSVSTITNHHIGLGPYDVKWDQITPSLRPPFAKMMHRYGYRWPEC